MKILKKASAALLLTAASSAYAGNFATCILDKLPGSANQPSHGAVFQACDREYPGRYTNVVKGSGRGLFGYKDGSACTIKKAKNTPFELSAMQIAFACRCLYDPATYENERCS